MQMSYGEIVRSYKEAKNPKAQIRVLAELNAVSKSEIAKILYEAGAINKMTYGQYQRQSKARSAAPADTEKVPTPAEMPNEAPAVPATPLTVPETVVEMVKGALSELKSAYGNAKRVVTQYEEMEAFLAAAEKKAE